jgi:hypothetical protein
MARQVRFVRMSRRNCQRQSGSQRIVRNTWSGHGLGLAPLLNLKGSRRAFQELVTEGGHPRIGAVKEDPVKEGVVITAERS